MSNETTTIAPIRYVMGLMFNAGFQNVALIKKTKPAWQRGRFNGIGGKMEDGEGPHEAMCREFEEEAAVKTSPDRWKMFLTMKGKNDDGAPFVVDCFCCRGPLNEIKSLTDEIIYMIPIHSIRLVSSEMIENVPWVIGAAIDVLKDGRPTFITVEY